MRAWSALGVFRADERLFEKLIARYEQQARANLMHSLQRLK